MRRLIFLLPLLLWSCSPPEERPPSSKLIQKAEGPYVQKLGYCYFRSPPVLWKPETLVRGDVKVRGQRKGSQLKIDRVFYRLRGDLRRDNNYLEIRSRTWGLDRSHKLRPSSGWSEIKSMNLPRPARVGERGVFRFQFNQPLQDKVCRWTFRF